MSQLKQITLSIVTLIMEHNWQGESKQVDRHPGGGAGGRGRARVRGALGAVPPRQGRGRRGCPRQTQGI